MTKEEIIKELKRRGITEGCEFWCAFFPNDEVLSGWTWDYFVLNEAELHSTQTLPIIEEFYGLYKNYAFLYYKGRFAKPLNPKP